MPYDPRQDPKYKNDKLFLSLINQESKFNPNAVSPTGARGLTQVLPSTARDPGFGISPNTAALTDPEQNVAFGKAYFDAMQKRYNGDKAAALVAYNGGPSAADRWVDSGKNDKVISKESSNYYKTILSNAGMDFSKIKAKLPSGVDDGDAEDTTGFSKLKKPGTADAAKPSEDSTDESEESNTETEDTTKETPKVKKAKASKEKDDEDDDEEDDDAGGKSSKSDFSFDPEAAIPKLKAFEPGLAFKPVPVTLGSPKLQIAPLEIDNPRDR